MGEGLSSWQMNGGRFLAAPMESRRDLTVPQSLPAPLLVSFRLMASSSLHCRDTTILSQSCKDGLLGAAHGEGRQRGAGL